MLLAFPMGRFLEVVLPDAKVSPLDTLVFRDRYRKLANTPSFSL